MSELTQYYTEFAQAGAWASPEKGECGCRGSGWFLSEVDTVHRCSYHYNGQPHPEEEDDAGDPPLPQDDLVYAEWMVAPEAVLPPTPDDDFPF